MAQTEAEIKVEVDKKLADLKDAGDAAAKIKADADKVVKDNLAAAEKAEKDAKEAAVHEKGGSPLQDAKEVLKKITEQNKITAENLKKQEELQAELMISGRAPAGQGSLSEDERKDAAARKLIEGSGFEERLFPTPEEKAAAARK